MPLRGRSDSGCYSGASSVQVLWVLYKLPRQRISGNSAVVSKRKQKRESAQNDCTVAAGFMRSLIFVMKVAP